jgi:hypothetical protein
MTFVDLPALVKLVRLPSVVTVPGDVLAGDAWGGHSGELSIASLIGSSSLTYLAGMALNDWADRDEDAIDRPGRPIPAGDVKPAVALTLATALSAAGLALAARGGRGLRTLSVAAPLTAAVWTYDLRAKQTPAGPGTMALARALDVLVGAGRLDLDAAPAACLVGAHTLLITIVSRREAQGATPVLAVGALAGAAATTVAAARLARGGDRTQPAGAAQRAALVCVGLYACTMGQAGLAALRDPSAASLQRFVGAGVFANMPLQASLLAARGRVREAAAVLAAWPLGRRVARKVAVT